VAQHALAADAYRRERRGNVGALAVDRRRVLWVGSADGIETIDTISGKRRVVYTFAAGASEDREVGALLIAGDGTVWAATSAGVLHILPDSDRVDPVAADLTGPASSLVVAKGGILYVGAQQGLFRLDPGRDFSERVWPKAPAAQSASTHNVHHLVQDPQGR